MLNFPDLQHTRKTWKQSKTSQTFAFDMLQVKLKCPFKKTFHIKIYLYLFFKVKNAFHIRLNA